ncbi:MAG: MmgE/PrpD family protein, partial [Gammaproteobacteria bacterium]
MSTAAIPASSGEFETVVSGIEALSAWATGVRWDDLPEAVRRRAALVLADDLGAMIAARSDPECERLVTQMLRTGGPAQASVFDGKGKRTDRYTAAAANAAAGTWCELDEGYRRTICHAGIYVVPALLAQGEASDATARDLVRSLAVAYEIVTRFARAFPGTTRHLHPHGCLAAVGAAAAVALVRGVDEQQLRSVLDAACCMVNPMPFDQAFGGALVRNVAAALGAGSGMRAADWAPLGITALATAPLGVFKLGFGAE